MKEQWKKLDSDAKLLVNVEEGRQLPIKINIPLEALTPREDYCCNRLVTVLRVCVLLALLSLIGWTAMSLYTRYELTGIPVDDDINLENKYTFQNLVYQKKDDIEAKEQYQKSDPTEEFKDLTKKSLDQIAAEIKGLNEKLDQIKIEKEQQIITAKVPLDDSKTIEEENISSDPTFDSMLNEIAVKVGLTGDQQSDKVVLEYKPEVDAIIITEPIQSEIVNSQDNVVDAKGMDMMTLLEQLGIEPAMRTNIDESHEESGYRSPLINEGSYPPMVLGNPFWNEKSNEDAELDAIIRNEQARQDEYFGMWDKIFAENMNVGHYDESHEEDKQVEQVMQSILDRIASSNIENDNDSKQQEQEAEDEVKPEVSENVEEDIISGLILQPLLELLGDDSSKETMAEKMLFENDEESQNEDKVEKEMIEQVSQDFNDDLLSQIVQETLGDMLAKELVQTMDEEEVKPENEEKQIAVGSLADMIESLFLTGDDQENENEKKVTNSQSSDDTSDRFAPVDYDYLIGSAVDDTQQREIPTIIPEGPREFWGATVQEEPAVERSLIDMVPSVEYVKKIEANPFIPRVAKMLEPMVGQNHELLIWYYTHKDLPDFLRGADKWKVFGAKLLYDSNIKDYPADATIVLGLSFEKVLEVAEYPSSNEEIQPGLQQEIVNRLILKSYLNKMLLEGDAEAETLSQVIEQHNQEKLKELEIDPQQLTYKGDFFEVNNNDDLVIPVVQFDPFVDDSREANEQRTQVLKAFTKTRIFDEAIEPSREEEGPIPFFDSISYKAPEQLEETKVNTEDVFGTTKETSEGFLGHSVGVQTSEDFDSSDILMPYSSSAAPISEEATEENIPTEEEEGEVDMNQYLFHYDDPFDW